MAINLSNNPLSAIKLGESDILKGYVGANQMFPNATEITGAAFTNASTNNTAKAESYVVSGDIGSSFSFGSYVFATGPSGTQVLSASPTTYQMNIEANSVCGTAARYPSVTIVPEGSTTLASGVPSTDTILQDAAASVVTNNIGLTQTVTNSVYQTVTVGGQTRWAQGAAWIITVNYTQGTYANAVSGLRLSVLGVSSTPNVAATFNFTAITPSGNCGVENCTAGAASQVFWGANPTQGGTYSVLATLANNISTQAMTFTTDATSSNSPACVVMVPGSVASGNVFP